MAIDAVRAATLAGSEARPDKDAVEFGGANAAPPLCQPLQLIHKEDGTI